MSHSYLNDRYSRHHRTCADDGELIIDDFRLALMQDTFASRDELDFFLAPAVQKIL